MRPEEHDPSAVGAGTSRRPYRTRQAIAEPRIKAGLDLNDSVLRYAEVEQYGSRFRLVRLGSCFFEFNAADEILKNDNPAHIETIGEAIYDVFSGSSATSMHVAVHPSHCLSFFAPVPAGLTDDERWRRLSREAALVSSDSGIAPFRLTVDRAWHEQLADGQEVDWYHVMALHERIYARFDRIFRNLPGVEYRLRLSTQSAAGIMARLNQRRHQNGVAASFSMAIGLYQDHAEYALCRGGDWYFSHHAPAQTPDDCVYFSVSLLQRLRLHPRKIERLYLYGSGFSAAESGILSSIYGVEPEDLNPTQAVALDPASLSTTFDSEAYVPCIGATL